MDRLREYRKAAAEYDRLVVEYELATAHMLKVAADSRATIRDLKAANGRVAEITEKLSNVRTAIGLLAHRNK